MPAKSRAQQKWAFWAEKHPKQAKVTKKVAKEFEQTVPNPPARVTPKKKGKK